MSTRIEWLLREGEFEWLELVSECVRAIVISVSMAVYRCVHAWPVACKMGRYT